MPYRTLILAMMLAACSVSEENATNEAADGNAVGQTGDVPILADNGVQPQAPGNQQAPGAPPPADGTQPPEPSGEVTLAAAPSTVAAGRTVTLTLANGSNQAVGYNLCTSALETAGGAAVNTDRVCTMELRTLRPGRNATYAYELPGSLAEGRYRFVAGIERMQTGARTVVRSNLVSVR